MHQTHLTMRYFILLTISFLGFFSACEKTSISPGDLVPKTVDEDPTLPSIYVNNVQLHAESFGNPSDPLVVVIHGGPGGDYRSLRPYKALVQDGYHVVFYDQRGAGLSVRLDIQQLTFEDYLADLDAVVEYYKTTPNEKVILFGHSWGAMQATMYINQYPNKVKGAILDEPGALTKTQLDTYLSRFSSSNVFTESMSNIVWSEQIITTQNHIQLDYQAIVMLKNSIGNDGSSKTNPIPFWRMGGASFVLARSAGDFDWTSNLHQYTSSILFIHSNQNPAYPNTWAEQLSSFFPMVTRIQIKGVGHDAHYQKFDTYLQHVRHYLKTL